MERHARSVGVDGVRRTILATTSLAAGGIHAVVIPEHLRESPLIGLFFAATAVFQIGWAMLIEEGRDRDERLLSLGAALNGAVVVVWVLSRTVGVPLGPEPWTPEPKGVLDVIATVLEVVLVATALLWSGSRDRDRHATG